MPKTVTKKTVKKAAPKAAKKTVKKTAAKTPKKTAAKKSSAAKRTPQKSAAKKSFQPLTQASDETSFWTTNGEVLNDLVALKHALSGMDSTVFSYHVTADKNDFADWVECVLNDGDCAAALRKAKTPQSASTTVVRYLKFYNV